MYTYTEKETHTHYLQNHVDEGTDRFKQTARQDKQSGNPEQKQREKV